MTRPRRIAIVGATSAIAGECARCWLANGVEELILIGRDDARLRLCAETLAAQAPLARIRWQRSGFSSAADIGSTVSLVCDPSPPDIVLIAHGTLPDQDRCQSDLDECERALVVNGLSVALFAEGFAQHMKDVDGSRLALIGSVAGDRGRQSNYVYGCAKSMVARLAEGLQHRLALQACPLKVVLVKPGPTATPMTRHLAERGEALASAEAVARIIVDGIATGTPVIYAPRKWRWIMLIARHIPRVLFHRMRI